MKNYTLTIIAGLLILSPVVASASFDTSLKYGARGQAVIELQDLLTNEDCLNSNSTGYFGLLTLKAVKCFQTKYNLPSTGFFGVMSRTKANEIVANITAPSNAAAQAETGTTPSPTPSQSSTTKPKTFTLPNGTVIDAQGNIISTPSTNTNTIPAPTYTPTPAQTPIPTVSESVPTEISIQNQVCNLSQTNLKTEYQLYDLLQNGNTDGRIFMNAYILKNMGQNYYTSNPNAKIIVTTSNYSNDKTINGSGNTSPCGYYYPYEFYATQIGIYTINYSIPEFNLSKTITLNIVGAEKPIIGYSGITISTPQKETDYPLSELANLNSTSNVKYWFQTSKPNYRYNISAWCSDADTPSSKIDLVSHLEQDGLYYYRGYFSSSDKFLGITTCKFIHNAVTSVAISSESDTVTFDVK